LRSAFVRLPLLVLLLAALAAGSTTPASGQTGLEGQRAAAATLKAAVAAESRRIGATQAGLADAESRLVALTARVVERQGQLDRAQNRLVQARVRLTRLQRKEARAKVTLSDNLRTAYETGKPSYVTVVISSRGFVDLLEKLQFIKRVSRRNASILDVTRQARADVKRQTGDLESLRVRYSALARDAIGNRNQADVLRNALLRRQESQLARRSGASAKLAVIRGSIGRIERRQAAAARQAQMASTAAVEAPKPAAPSAGGGGTPSGGGGSGAVAKVVAAANQIATTPYVWGGGHGGSSGGYDCSGSISYALAAAGLLSSPLDSTGFESWGDPGPGKHITVYANAGHAFMIVDGRRFDTSNLSGGGTRWTSASRSTAGFVARHPPGL
jgi:cell wall-associated NlpC family hydrolase